MSFLLRSDPISRIHPENPQSLADFDHFDLLPDSLLLLIFDKVADVKDLGRCCIVSRRFHSLVPFVENALIRVDCVISDDDSAEDRRFSLNAASTGSFAALFRLIFSPIYKPFQALGQFLVPKRSSSSSFSPLEDEIGVTHHSPTQVLKNFTEIRVLKIELPTGELGIEDGNLLKWRADFGSTLDNCMILIASSVTQSNSNPIQNSLDSSINDENDTIPESFYTNGGLKLRVVWTISSLIAASARHYLLQPIITEHKSLDRLILSDADGQGVLTMNKEQLEELRVTPLSASSASKRTLVPALNMRLWYAPELELGDGMVLKGATLVAIRPSESKKEVCDGSWLSDAFEEPFGTAAKMLIKRRTYCLEMNSF